MPNSWLTRGTTDRPRLEALALGCLALALGWFGNDRTALWDRDEPRYAGATREMIASGDWIDISFNAEPRYHKPILTYWFMLGGYALAGDNPFGARLVSGVMGAIACAMVYGMGRRWFGIVAGRCAGLMYATSPMMVVESKLSTTDAILTCFLLGAWWSLRELTTSSSRTIAAAFWACLALATLTKGPVGPALIVVSTLGAALCGVPWRGWVRNLRWGWGIPLFLAIAAPWFVAIGLISQGEFFKVAMGYHVVRRMTTGIEEHGGFLGYYVVLGFATLLPWSVFLPAAVRAAWTRRHTSPDLGFLLGWMFGPLIMFELVRTKLIHYVYPAMPAAVLLTGWLAARLIENTIRIDDLGRWWPMARRGLLATALALFGAAAVAEFYLSDPVRNPVLAVGLAGVVGIAFAWRPLQTGNVAAGVTRLALAWVAMLAVAGGWLCPRISDLTVSDRMGKRLAALVREHGGAPIFATYYHPAAVYGYGSPVPQIQSCDKIAERAALEGLLIAPLLRDEVAVLKRDHRVNIEVLESIEGLNVVKGRIERLNFTLIRPADRIAGARDNQPLTR